MGDSIRKQDGRSQELDRRRRTGKTPRPLTSINSPGPLPITLYPKPQVTSETQFGECQNKISMSHCDIIVGQLPRLKFWTPQTPTGAAERSPPQSSLKGIDIHLSMRAIPSGTFEAFSMLESREIHNEDCATRLYRGDFLSRSRRLSVKADRGQCFKFWPPAMKSMEIGMETG